MGAHLDLSRFPVRLHYQVRDAYKTAKMGDRARQLLKVAEDATHYIALLLVAWRHRPPQTLPPKEQDEVRWALQQPGFGTWLHLLKALRQPDFSLQPTPDFWTAPRSDLVQMTELCRQAGEQVRCVSLDQSLNRLNVLRRDAVHPQPGKAPQVDELGALISSGVEEVLAALTPLLADGRLAVAETIEVDQAGRHLVTLQFQDGESKATSVDAMDRQVRKFEVFLLWPSCDSSCPLEDALLLNPFVAYHDGEVYFLRGRDPAAKPDYSPRPDKGSAWVGHMQDALHERAPYLGKSGGPSPLEPEPQDTSPEPFTTGVGQQPLLRSRLSWNPLSAIKDLRTEVNALLKKDGGTATVWKSSAEGVVAACTVRFRARPHEHGDDVWQSWNTGVWVRETPEGVSAWLGTNARMSAFELPFERELRKELDRRGLYEQLAAQKASGLSIPFRAVPLDTEERFNAAVREEGGLATFARELRYAMEVAWDRLAPWEHTLSSGAWRTKGASELKRVIVPQACDDPAFVLHLACALVWEGQADGGAWFERLESQRPQHPHGAFGQAWDARDDVRPCWPWLEAALGKLNATDRARIWELSAVCAAKAGKIEDAVWEPIKTAGHERGAAWHAYALLAAGDHRSAERLGARALKRLENRELKAADWDLRRRLAAVVAAAQVAQNDATPKQRIKAALATLERGDAGGDHDFRRWRNALRRAQKNGVPPSFREYVKLERLAPKLSEGEGYLWVEAARVILGTTPPK